MTGCPHVAIRYDDTQRCYVCEQCGESLPGGTHAIPGP